MHSELRGKRFLSPSEGTEKMDIGSRHVIDLLLIGVPVGWPKWGQAAELRNTPRSRSPQGEGKQQARVGGK